MSESVPLPSPQNILLSLRRLREELAAVRKNTVERDELVRSGLAKTGTDGKLVVSNDLLQPVHVEILGIAGRLEGAAAAVEKLETWAFDKDGSFEVGARKLTQLDAELRMLRGEGADVRAALTAVAQAREQLEARVQATEERVLVESQKRTELFARVNIADGMAVALGEGIRANATATQELTARVDVTEEKIDVITESVTTLRTEIEGEIAGFSGLIEANSTAIGNLTSRTTAVEGSITTQAGQLTSLHSSLTAAEATIATTAGGLSALTTTVSNINGVVTAHSQQLTQLTTDVGGAQSKAEQAITASNNAASIAQSAQTTAGDAASAASLALSVADGAASAITQVSSQQAASDFSATVSWDFRGSLQGFVFTNASAALFPVASDSGVGIDNGFDPRYQSPLTAVPGSTSYVVRAMIRRRVPGTWDGGLFWATDGHGLSGSYRAQSVSVPPADGQWHLVEWNLSGVTDWRNSTIRRLWFDFENSAGSTTDIRWIAVGSNVSQGNPAGGGAASVVQTMRTEIDTVSGRTNAKWGIVTDVNGYWTGIESVNNGTRGEVNIRADVFRITSPGGGQRTEYSDGNWRIYGASGQLRVRLGVWN